MQGARQHHIAQQSAEPCRHPYLRSTPDLDHGRPVFVCECGAVVPCRDRFDEQVWNRGRITAIARAIQADAIGEVDALVAGMGS